MPDNALLVKIDQFEGPLDLLLYLINKNEIDIYDINVTMITEEYLNYIDEMQKLELEVASEYIVMASTLIKIKAACLLPRYGDNEDVDDPRQPLIDRLLEYQKIKHASELFRNIESEARRLFGRNITVQFRETVEEEELSIVDLMNVFTPILKRGISLTSYRMHQKKMTISEKISEIMGLVEETDEMNISDYMGSLTTVYDIVLTFIAILEMTNKHIIKILQKEQFESIWIKKY